MNARAAAFFRCPETCHEALALVKEKMAGIVAASDVCHPEAHPQDIAALEEKITRTIFEIIKDEATDKVRRALVECESERLKALDELADAEGERDVLRERVVELEKGA